MPDSEELTVEPRTLEGFPNAACLRLSGQCGPRALRRLQEVLQPLLAQGKKDFLFDCAGVDFFNSTALGFMINLSDTVQSAGGTVSFCRMTKKVYATFDLLGLGELLRFYPDEEAWARSAREKATPAEPPTTVEFQELEKPAAAAPNSPISFSLTLPAWLEEVDHVQAPPLDHVRWSAFLQSAIRRMEVNPIGAVAAKMGVPATGPMAQVVRQVLKKSQDPQDLLDLFEQSALARMCRIFGLSAGGGKSDLIRGIISFVNRSTTQSLSSSAALPDEIPQEAPPAAPEVPPDRVVQALESCPVAKLPRSESAARNHLLKHLAGVLGKEEVSRNREVGRQVKTKVEIDVSQRAGVLVRAAGSLFGKKSVDLKKVTTLLGQVVLLSGIYGRGNLFVVLVGEAKGGQDPALGELRGLVDGAGGRVIHLHA